MRERRLGRGIEALIPSSEARAGLLEVSVDDITPNPYQPRHAVDAEALQALADSIREHGLIQPLIVTMVDGHYQLIAGERRWMAARLAGLARVPVVVKEATPQAMLELALIENLQRADLNPLEEAAAYRQLIDEFGLTQETVAERVGKHRVTVANALRLLQLPEPVKNWIAEGKLSEGHARALMPLRKADILIQGARQVIQRDLSVRQTEEMVRRLTTPVPLTEPRPKAPELESIENQFQEALGTKVQLIRSRKGGRVVIHFYSDEELQGIYDVIVGP